MNVLLRSARIIDSNSRYHKQVKDILIQNGMIVKIGKALEAPKNVKIIELKNLHVSAGWFAQ